PPPRRTPRWDRGRGTPRPRPPPAGPAASRGPGAGSRAAPGPVPPSSRRRRRGQPSGVAGDAHGHLARRGGLAVDGEVAGHVVLVADGADLRLLEGAAL